MSLTFQLSIRPNVSPAARRRIHSDAALIADGLECMTEHQVQHLRPALVMTLAKAAARQSIVREVSL